MFYEVIAYSRERMTGNRPLELNHAVPGGRVELFAIQDDEIGWHHRHVRFSEDTEIEDTNDD